MMANLNTEVIYYGILTLGNVGTAVYYRNIIMTLAPASVRFGHYC